MTEDIKAEPSEAELIRRKSVDPAFLKECDIESRKTYEANEEHDYAELLERRNVYEIVCRDAARARMEKDLKL
jgi:hypothetical protein